MFLGTTWKQAQFVLQKLLISLTTGIYSVINYTYRIFLILVHFNMFTTNDYDNFVTKVYFILGVIVLFVIASSLLTSIVDPDKNKGGQSIEKLLKNVFTSIIMIVACPFLFSMATRIQNVIIDGGTISSLFGASGTVDSKALNGAVAMEFSTFQAFFYGKESDPSSLSIDSHKILNYNGEEITDELGDFDENNDWQLACTSDGEDFETDVKSTDAFECTGSECKIDCEENECTFSEAQAYAQACDDYTPYKWFAVAIAYDQLDFHFFLSIAAGIYLVYVFIGFCFDVVSRLLKLFFYEIMAPLCIACRIIPSKEGVFKTWWKGIYSTYISVFVRIFVVELGLWIISRFCTADNVFLGISNVSNNSFVTNNFARLFLVMGIVTFIKQGPKIITDLFGLEEVQIGGITKKFKEGLSPTFKALGAAGAVGGGLLAGNYARKHYKDTNMGNGKKHAGARALGYGLVSGTLGYAAGSVLNKIKGSEIGKDVSNTWNNTKNNAAESSKKREENELNREIKSKWRSFRKKGANGRSKEDDYKDLLDAEKVKKDAVKPVQDELDAAKSEVSDAKKQLEIAQDKMEEIQSAKDKMNQTSVQIGDLDIEINGAGGINAQFDQKQAELNALKEQLNNDPAPQYSDLPEKIKKKEEELAEISATRKSKTDELNALKQQLIDENGGTMPDLATKIAEYDAQIASQQSVVDFAENVLDAANVRLNDAQIEFTQANLELKDVQAQIDTFKTDNKDEFNGYNQWEGKRMERQLHRDSIINGKDLETAMDKLDERQKAHNADLEKLVNKFAYAIQADFTKFGDIAKGSNMSATDIENLGNALKGKSYSQIQAIANSLAYSRNADGFYRTLSSEDQKLFSEAIGNNFSEFQANFAKWNTDGLQKATYGAMDDFITGVKTANEVFVKGANVSEIKQHETYANADASLSALETMIDKSGIVQAISSMKEEFRDQAKAYMKDGKLNVTANMSSQAIEDFIQQMDNNSKRKELFDDISAIKNTMATAKKNGEVLQDLISIQKNDKK